MQVISLCSQKGGSGKTTLTGHLAVQADRQGGGPVALIDCDPQGSLAAWWNSRAGDRPAFVQTSLSTLGADLQLLCHLAGAQQESAKLFAQLCAGS